MLNQVVLQGRLARDPQLRHTPQGTAVTAFTLAVERDLKDKQTDQRAVDFIEVVAWRQTAEFVCRFFCKGQMAVAQGRLQLRDWSDQQGQSRRVAEVVAERVYFAGPRVQPGPGAVPPGEPPAFSEVADEGDLPF